MTRLATPEDLPVVTTMIREFLLEQHKDGSPVLVSRLSVEFYRDLARSYVTGSLAGVVALDDTGFAMMGEDWGLPRIDSSLGRAAIVWCVWVTPSERRHHRMLELLRFAEGQLQELGFELGVMHVREANTAGRALSEAFGATLVERVYHYDLSKRT